MWCTLQAVEYGEQIKEGQDEGPPGEEGQSPGEPEQDGEAADAAHVSQHAPAGRLVVGVLPLDAGQLDHDHDEDEQAESEDQEEVGDHAHVEGDIVPQPAAKEDGRGREADHAFMTCFICLKGRNSQFLRRSICRFGIGNQTVVVFVHRYGDKDHKERKSCTEQEVKSEGPSWSVSALRERSSPQPIRETFSMYLLR